MKKQNKRTFADENSVRLPKGPMDAAIKAIEMLSPDDFDLKSLDVITDRSVLRSLHSFLKGKKHASAVTNHSNHCHREMMCPPIWFRRQCDTRESQNVQSREILWIYYF
eukprot:GHVH01002123.1.p2 GENE.GHVH01002123.1~~GHVH01002123.1.p2  ORF type:complete len:109 (-),score=10.45 GHVH01002123.1:1040-1366(-)